MRPVILLHGTILFAASFCFHVILWRVRRPANDMGMLFTIFLGLPVLILAVVVPLRLLPYGMAGYLHVLFLHYALSAVYVSSYPAAQAHSPSLDIFLIIAGTDRKKMTGDEIAKHYRDKDIVIDRIEDLKISGLLSMEEGVYRLRPVSLLIVWLYRAYRQLLNLEFGEG